MPAISDKPKSWLREELSYIEPWKAVVSAIGFVILIFLERSMWAESVKTAAISEQYNALGAMIVLHFALIAIGVIGLVVVAGLVWLIRTWWDWLTT